ncbi:PH domain-containing protein [Cellulomonas rhizosphaerae]|uniref:PH domain-containing protein n=1 Tax=Cellulomonas rhizosphaerae TaxID=2293719 RepID=A0A413RJC4_9CELL|nr:PH domain-containing protein [Cellulomonas rhizosphaerae]RHA38612.1 PH domain-containing protein [Cellulomonas rhizosphaerae]
MIDFDTASFTKLSPWDVQEAYTELTGILLPDEQVLLAFKGIRDSVSFTTRRIVALNVQGLTGKKKDYSSLPYSKIQAFSVETAGTWDRDSELELWFSGLGRVKFNFASGVDVRGLNMLISERLL